MMMIGWLIIHPSGWVETDYFQNKTWDNDGRLVSRKTWRRHFRPDCRMVRAKMSLVRGDIKKILMRLNK